MATMSEEETVCRQQPGLRHGCWVHAALSADAEAAVVGGKWSGSFRCGWLQALDPGLALHAHIADKSYLNLAKQKFWSSNILMSQYGSLWMVPEQESV